MAVYGVSCLFHDASISVIKGQDILFAAHTERYSREKNDPYLNEEIIAEAREHAEPDVVVYYENPWKKWQRQLLSGETLSRNPKRYLKGFFPRSKIVYGDHHRSHAAAGFFTSDFDSAAVLVADAIGEWATISVWKASRSALEKVHEVRYPHSLGLLYSAFTERCGLKPNEEEYILMGMAAYGRPQYVDDIRRDFLVEHADPSQFELKRNVHTGIEGWKPEANPADLAASIQVFLEEYLTDLLEWIVWKTRERNLVMMGGVALNCLANGNVMRWGRFFDDYWIMPNPGDAGSSLGAAAAYRFDQGKDPMLNWQTPYLGTNIDHRVNESRAVQLLLERGMVGLAHGRAEFGPRALGNRSLIADPRTKVVKARVNEVKQREQFRPFAPVVLQEFAHEWFHMPCAELPYMQFAVKAKMPGRIPAVVHADGTCRVQTVARHQNPVLYSLLRAWYDRTGVPVLLNTSMNVKGEPLVNTWADADRFSQTYGVPLV